MREIKEIIVHCSYTTPKMDIGAKEIRKWHLERGWKDIGYAYIIRRNGLIEKGRDTNKDGNVDDDIGAHALNHNAHSIGVCLVGGMAESGGSDCNFTFLQYKTLLDLLDSLFLKYPNATLHGHRDFANKDCPCFDVREFYR